MKVLLLMDLPKIGFKGEVKEVAEGYAHNFLLPQKKVVLATPENLRASQMEKEKKLRHEKEIRANLKKMANRLQGLTLEFTEKVDEKGQLFGGISSAQIAAALEQKGMTIEKNQIELDKSIKRVGKREVRIRLSSNLEINIKINVKAK